jgi:cell division protein FtsZ
MQAAISSPLLEDVTLDGATGLLVNITGGPSLTLHEVNDAVTLAQTAADPDANIIFGSVVDDRMGDEVKITVIATGFAPKEVPIRLDRQVSVPAHLTPRVAVAPAPARTVAAPPRAASPAPAQAPLAPHVETPRREVVPARAPVTVGARPAAPARPRERIGASDGFRPGDEDQYDIPAFLRLRGQNGVE